MDLIPPQELGEVTAGTKVFLVHKKCNHQYGNTAIGARGTSFIISNGYGASCSNCGHKLALTQLAQADDGYKKLGSLYYRKLE